jgi:hypothetical protein
MFRFAIKTAKKMPLWKKVLFALGYKNYLPPVMIA